MNRKQSVGKTGEEKACSHLKRQGYLILEKNFRTRSGELDIIAKDGEEIVFVEVKTRTDFQFGAPSEAVGWRKQNHMIRAAQYYIHQKQLYGLAARFDVVEVYLDKTKLFRRFSVNHIKNAFTLS